jgi:hypothetical protein
MAAFLFKLVTAEGQPADPPELSTVVYTWKAGDVIPPGHRSLRVVGVRDDADQPPVLVVEDVAE